MTDFFQFLLELVRASGSTVIKESYLHLLELAVILLGLAFSMGFGGFIALIWTKRSFRKRFFFDQMVIGVNTLHTSADGCCMLKLRTVVENNLGALLDHPILQRMVEKAARRCTEKNPILELKDEKDHALLLTKIQNAISSRFAKEYLLHMFGQPFNGQWAEFVVTCERYGGLKATKIRALVFVRADIQRLLDPEFFNKVAVEEPHHIDRLRTLQLIAKTRLTGKDIVHGRVEIPLSVL